MFAYLRLIPVVLLAALAGCGPDYSPNTYSTAAVQQANKVDQGVIAGYREVAIRADGTVGAITGGAAGGVLGAQAPDGGVITALSAIGGTLIGGLVGTGVEHVADDTKAFEYIVRKPGGDLISVTQRDTTPLEVGLKVLVIEGKQARIVPDYSVPPEKAAPSDSSAANTGKSAKAAKADKGTATDEATATDTMNPPAKTNLPDKADAGTTTSGAPGGTPSDAGPAPAQAPSPSTAATPPAPASGVAETGPAAQPAPSQPSETSAAPAAAPASPSAQQSAPAAQSPPAEGDQGGSSPPAPVMPAPAPAGSGSTP